MNITREETLLMLWADIKELTDALYTGWAIYSNADIHDAKREELRKEINAGFNNLEALLNTAERD